MKAERVCWILLALLLCAQVSHAGDLLVSWTPPTTCADGSSVAANCPVTGYQLWTASCTASSPLPGPLSGTPVATAPATATTFDFANTPANTTWCVTVAATSATGNSDQSAVAVGTVKVAPGAPSVQVTTATLKTTGTGSSPVYLATQIQDGWGFTQVGTVPAGTPCDPTQGTNGYNVVPQPPTLTVSWLTAVHPLAIEAICQ